MTERRCVAYGKQVLLDGHHIADASSPESAAVIADCVEYAGANWDVVVPEDARDRVESYLA